MSVLCTVNTYVFFRSCLLWVVIFVCHQNHYDCTSLTIMSNSWYGLIHGTVVTLFCRIWSSEFEVLLILCSHSKHIYKLHLIWMFFSCLQANRFSHCSAFYLLQYGFDYLILLLSSICSSNGIVAYSHLIFCHLVVCLSREIMALLLSKKLIVFRTS